MHAPREARRILDHYRQRHAASLRRKGRKPNGMIGWLDDIGLERLFENSKRRYRREKVHI